jgi:hypothetical protein
MELIGPYLIGCILLVVAGSMKAIRPDDTARAFASLMPMGLHPVLDVREVRITIRFLSIAETCLGVLALLVPRQLDAALVGASYLAFAVVVSYARTQGGALASCGCFGTPDSPATYLHAFVDLLLGAAAIATAVDAPTAGWIGSVLALQPLHGLPLALLVAVGTGVTFVAFSGLTRLQVFQLALRPAESTDVS